jgi:hypothetical protein
MHILYMSCEFCDEDNISDYTCCQTCFSHVCYVCRSRCSTCMETICPQCDTKEENDGMCDSCANKSEMDTDSD